MILKTGLSELAAYSAFAVTSRNESHAMLLGGPTWKTTEKMENKLAFTFCTLRLIGWLLSSVSNFG